MATIKGATEFDKLCHRVFDGARCDICWRSTGVHCAACGCELEYYYCEDRLVLVTCHACKKIALVKASSPAVAAYNAFGFPAEVSDAARRARKNAEKDT